MFSRLGKRTTENPVFTLRWVYKVTSKHEDFKKKFLIDAIENNWIDCLVYKIHLKAKQPSVNFFLEYMANKCRQVTAASFLAYKLQLNEPVSL